MAAELDISVFGDGLLRVQVDAGHRVRVVEGDDHTGTGGVGRLPGFHEQKGLAGVRSGGLFEYGGPVCRLFEGFDDFRACVESVQGGGAQDRVPAFFQDRAPVLPVFERGVGAFGEDRFDRFGRSEAVVDGTADLLGEGLHRVGAPFFGGMEGGADARLSHLRAQVKTSPEGVRMRF